MISKRKPNTSFLCCENVYQAYGPKVILDNIDLSVGPGELVTVVGPSGCGKSTLLRLIVGQERPIRGAVKLDDQVIMFPSRTTGVVYQNYSLFPNLTALQNVVFGHRLRRWPWQWVRDRKEVFAEANELLARVGMIDHSNKYPYELSGGQRQRIAIVQSIIQHPRVLCMDEPFSALDPGTREDMQLMLLELWKSIGMTVFFVTHDLEEAIYLGTRIVAVSRYYSDDRGNGTNVPRGAKVVLDLKLRDVGSAYAPKIKESPETDALVRRMREEAFNPAYTRHARDFALEHPDSWQTLTPAEDHVNGVKLPEV